LKRNVKTSASQWLIGDSGCSFIYPNQTLHPFESGYRMIWDVNRIHKTNRLLYLLFFLVKQWLSICHVDVPNFIVKKKHHVVLYWKFYGMVQVSDVAASKNGRHPSNLRIEKVMPHPDRFIVSGIFTY